MSAILLEVLFLFLLIAANGVFAMSELAVVSSRKSRLRQWADSGDRKARVALELANDPNRFLSTVQVGITLVGTLAGVFGGATIAENIADRLGAVPVAGPLRRDDRPRRRRRRHHLFLPDLRRAGPQAVRDEQPRADRLHRGDAAANAVGHRRPGRPTPERIDRARPPVVPHPTVRRVVGHRGRGQGPGQGGGPGRGLRGGRARDGEAGVPPGRQAGRRADDARGPTSSGSTWPTPPR